MAQIRIISPQAVGRVAITAIVPGIVTYHVYWDGGIEKYIPRAIQKGYEDKYKYIYHDEKGQMYEIGFVSIKPTKVYGAKSGTVNLIDLRCVQDVYRDGNKHYKLTINSQRAYANDIVCNGFSMSDGSPVVSSSHLNGKNGDIRYLRKDRNGKILDLTATPHELDIKKQIAWNEALYKFGWKSL